MQSRAYGKWSEEETGKMIQLTRSFKGNVINWRVIAQNIKGRTPQQCKSFYNSKIRSIEVNLQKYSPEDLAIITVQNLLDSNIIQSLDGIKRIFYDQILMEVIMNAKMIMQNSKQFKYNARILQTIRYVIILYNQHKKVWIDQISTSGFTEFMKTNIYANEFVHLQTLLDNSQITQLYYKITELLQQGSSMCDII
ncbi:SANT/Myb_domain [Hexamita inflata]|uniref:SANT/Myb domain n=1 Tax=Hexamita inflata TaxID=28002 RepID=A0AA86TP06_9EUKA|nr:SANT/Myb domain [Hexamita inflata]